MSTLRNIGALAPSNRQAGIVTGSGTHWEPDIKPSPGFVRSDTPLPMRPLLGSMKDIADLPGKRVGRLIVIGLAALPTHRTAHTARWVVRCDCGAYEHRKTKTLRSANAAEEMMCDHCNYLRKMKLGLHRVRPGPLVGG